MQAAKKNTSFLLPLLSRYIWEWKILWYMDRTEICSFQGLPELLLQDGTDHLRSIFKCHGMAKNKKYMSAVILRATTGAVQPSISPGRRGRICGSVTL